MPGMLLVECDDESSTALKRSGVIPKEAKVIRLHDFNEAVDFTRSLAASPDKKIKKVTYDNISGLVRWCDSQVINGMNRGLQEFIEFGGTKGEKEAYALWADFIEALKELRDAGVWVFLIGHSVISNTPNPSGDDYLRNVPQIGVLTKDGINRFEYTTQIVDATIYYTYRIGTKGAIKGKGAKAEGSGERVMYADGNPSYYAKNRLGLPDIIEPGESAATGAKALFEALKKGSDK